jgi:hypothetical protein
MAPDRIEEIHHQKPISVKDVLPHQEESFPMDEAVKEGTVRR